MADFSLILEQVKRREREIEERRQELQDLVCDITEAEREKVIKKGSKDFFYFAKKVFPEYCTKPFSELHRDIVKFSLTRQRYVDLVAGPPEHGKTAIHRIWKIWAALYGFRHYQIKVTETMPLSQLDLASIKLEFETNQRIIFLYGNLKTSGFWETDRFKVAPTKFNKYGCWFKAFAFGVPPTGRLLEMHRPDHCDIDDLENYKKSGNVVISKEKLQFINNDIIPRISNDGHIIWFGNNARKTMAMNMIIEMPEEERLRDYPAFRVHIYPAWDKKKARPLWHEAYSFKTEEEMRMFFAVGMMTWQGNYMQNPMVPDGTEFKKMHWREYSKLPNDALGIIMCDPASGDSGCFKALVPLFFSQSAIKFYCPEVFLRQTGWEPYFKEMYDMYLRYQKRVRFIGWEKDFHQDQFLEFKKIYPSVKDLPDLPIRPMDVKGNGPKMERIRTLSVPYEMGHILFHDEFLKSKDGMEAQTQMVGFPDYSFVDFPDCMASAYRIVFNMFAGTFMKSSLGINQPAYQSLGQSRVNRNSF
jgi:hypothetical protein